MNSDWNRASTSREDPGDKTFPRRHTTPGTDRCACHPRRGGGMVTGKSRSPRPTHQAGLRRDVVAADGCELRFRIFREILHAQDVPPAGGPSPRHRS